MVSLFELVGLGFGGTILLIDFPLSSAALAIKACFRSSLAILLGAVELERPPPVLSSKLLRCSLTLGPMTSIVVEGFSFLVGSPS